jgi:hypothetical protein
MKCDVLILLDVDELRTGREGGNRISKSKVKKGKVMGSSCVTIVLILGVQAEVLVDVSPVWTYLLVFMLLS